MYKKWNKSASKRFLLFGLIIFFGGLILTFLLMLGLGSRDMLKYDLSNLQLFCIAVGCALVSVSSFTGFSVLFVSVGEQGSKQLMLLVVLAIPLTIFVIPFGVAMLIPTTIISIKKSLQ